MCIVFYSILLIIKYIPLQQGLRLITSQIKHVQIISIIKYIPLQQGLRQFVIIYRVFLSIIKYIPLQQGLRLPELKLFSFCFPLLLSIFHYNKD